MLLILRFLVVILFSIAVCVLGLVYCSFTPRDPRHVSRFGRLFAKLSVVFGLKVHLRQPEGETYPGCYIYIANHQNNYDMITAANVVLPGTVTVGKKSLVWIPFFGPLYWLTGNLLIDRENRAKAHGTIAQVVKHIKERHISVWMFPEGTRSRGRGLMPFKTGAFHAAISAGVPIVPICVSTTHGKIKLNRWNNGHAIVEMLPPIDTSAYGKDQVRELAIYCHEVMAAKIAELDEEVARLNAAQHG
ncbi:1-acylglycerol-3-phosphate O-acyltransferase [Musicola paradisiaca]|uniref:1-acyl-sn-glycerol-3-phosphate acyltransferase n=1 Tax=Musicola paradisiaca (strain Ech703) TaxID=579405 RepID=C6C441_MUSP7|nr:1-acylglycerol-3-phosphate O-acyltransferase [Musicola paradisiaca]ACS87368.1 1-acyl-sn-glycerol-3-phosphate acyltransferase [Musicola paradisiaca Ech703]